MATQLPPIMPGHLSKLDTRIMGDYDLLRAMASQMTGYVKIKMDVRVALALAEKSPYPRGVKLGVMKQVANSRQITLEQMRILLGFAAQRAQR